MKEPFGRKLREKFWLPGILVYLRPYPAAGHLVYLRLCPAAACLVTAIPKRSKGRLAGNINPLRSASKLFQIAFDVRYSFKFSYSFKQFGVLISQLEIVWFENIKCMTKTSYLQNETHQSTKEVCLGTC